ncbi:MAG TPA: uroporphyrinogen decarboxylase family protein [Candidatus Hydrogenedentes bacterium]|nr:uroporphyrinogen decarboxylase family protein [Candidatus Hydrogenedentota bacterium]HOL76658.1 uroporphyrinogen decarboxylase family protein [Candidatus Hydrogenedentota bacterium]HPO84491.1 uroporphyrinogen decarboxylase family protein [Candidatus Hydrogenedentota bacterium]
MSPRERVIRVIRRESFDRIPIYGWVSANLTTQITEAFGSVAAFEDKYEFDYAHLFGGPPTFSPAAVDALRNEKGGVIDPPAALDLPLTNPDDLDAYKEIVVGVKHHKEERERFVYVQTPGIFEALNGLFGIENHLLYLLMYPEELHEVYKRQAEWNRAFANNCIDLGVDMVHVSDDWGAQNALMFSMDIWQSMIFPYHKVTADAVRRRGAFLSLHSDGNVMSVVDGIIELGYHVLHPWQESAGMDLGVFKDRYRSRLTVMGGLDVQTTIGFGRTEFLVKEIERILSMFADGGLLFCTSHFVQDHCTMEELTLAYDTVYRIVRKLGNNS